MSDNTRCKHDMDGEGLYCNHLLLSHFYGERPSIWTPHDGHNGVCIGCPGHEPAQEQPATCPATTLAGPDRKFRRCEREPGHDGPHMALLGGQAWKWVDEPALVKESLTTGSKCQHGHLARVCVHCENEWIGGCLNAIADAVKPVSLPEEVNGFEDIPKVITRLAARVTELGRENKALRERCARFGRRLTEMGKEVEEL